MNTNITAIETRRKRGEKRMPEVKKVMADVLVKGKIDFQYRHIVSVWPLVDKMTTELAYYLLDVVPSVDKNTVPLLEKCITEGINAWQEGEAQGKTEADCFCEYLRGMLASLPEVLEFSIFINGSHSHDPIYWDPCAQTIYHWIAINRKAVQVKKRSRPHDRYAVRVEPAEVRAKFLYSVINLIDLGILSKNVDYVLGKTDEYLIPAVSL